MDYYAFDEPVPAVNSYGNEYTACQTIIMSRQDAIGHWRAEHPGLNKYSDALILSEFITINYAYKVYPIHKVNEHK